jgi:hypothetical protein
LAVKLMPMSKRTNAKALNQKLEDVSSLATLQTSKAGNFMIHPLRRL